MQKKKFRLKNWEYWPFYILYIPVFFYYGWLVLKHRSFFFFTSSNPSIDFGGMFGEKKSEIFCLIPDQYIPKTKLVRKKDLHGAYAASRQIGFPLIAKPNIGERGIWVKKLATNRDLEKYVAECPADFLLQELVSYPIELGVFYMKMPREEKGMVTSIVRKDFLSVKGDGKSSIIKLLRQNPRALLTVNLKSDYLKKIGNTIPARGEKVVIEPIGNHCRGTQFLNDYHEIDDKLNKTFDKIANCIPGFYFGRFDLKCQSYKDLKQLKNFKILELNGAGAEPSHIYQPGYPLLRAYKDIFWHLRMLSDISEQNRKNGIPFWSFKLGYQKWKAHHCYNRLLSA